VPEGRKKTAPTEDFEALEQKAAEVSQTLRLLAHDKRLLVLCRLVQEPELSVTDLCEEVHLSQSALSQHLAKLRADGLVTTRREGQTIYYRLADGRVASLLAALYDIYCAREARS
jgi:ArsR family transcriptional regulator, virulence genes transcriptional regulator